MEPPRLDQTKLAGIELIVSPFHIDRTVAFLNID